MLKKTLKIFLFISLMLIGSVSASDDVDYTLTITKDYDFNEVINYSLSNYKSIKNGNIYFNTIVNDDIYTDIDYKVKYKKEKQKVNGKYKVKLSHTYSEYGMGNSNFLNNCFEDVNYDYDKETISFSGSKFNCFNGDSLKISIVTDFDVIESNAIVKGNTYTWNPTGYDFAMNISLNKPLEEAKADNAATDNDYVSMNDEAEVSDDNETEVKEETKAKNSISPLVIALIIGIAFIFILITILVLKAKANKNNSL